MTQHAIVFETPLTRNELEYALQTNGVLRLLADVYGADPHVVSLAPQPADAATIPVEA